MTIRLQAVDGDSLYGTACRAVLRAPSTASGSFDRIGRLPVPTSGGDALRYRLKTSRPWKTAVATVVGTFPSVNVWPLTDTDLIATADRWLFVSHDGGRTWTTGRELPPSSGPMGVLPTGVCRADDGVYLGEYPLDSTATPRVLRSTDAGDTWTPILHLDGVRHVHAVQLDPYTNDLWLTTGDTDDECRIGRLRDGEFDVVGSGSQRWRAVELAFTRDAILWGMDSVYADRNRIMKLPRSGLEGSRLEPETVHVVDSSVYYSTTFAVDDVEWAVFSTAMEAGPDSTGPAGHDAESGPAVVVAASSATDYTEWHELASYRRRRTVGDRWNPGNSIPISNAYVFLDAHEGGVFYNPYNTGTDHGRLLHFDADYFRRLRDGTAR